MKLFFKHTNVFVLGVFTLLLTACGDRDDGPSEIINARPVSPYYFVKKGETLADVAAKHSMKEDEIIALNNLKPPYTLFERQRILVRVIGKSNAGYLKTESDITVKELDAEDTKDGDKTDNEKDGTLDFAADDAATSEAGLPNNGLTEKRLGLSSIAPDGFGANAASAPGSGTAAPGGAVSAGFSWPVKGKIVTKFGQKMPDGTISDSIQIKAPVGTKIKAAGAGKVQKAGETIPSQPGLGKIVSVKHLDGKMSIYAHLKEVTVKKGQELKAGQDIGRIGKFGNDSTLFFQVRKQVGGKPIPTDPEQFLP